MRNLFFWILFLGLSPYLHAQNARIKTSENIGWLNYLGTFKLHEKWSLHTEFQFRRTEWLAAPQQNLLRTGLNYHPNPRTTLRLGYAFVETYAYGDIPINVLGRNFSEHRIFQMLQLSHKEGKFDLSHRFMLEQRFIGRYSSAMVSAEDEFPLLNRARYLFRAQYPLKGDAVNNHTPYLAAYDEILIGFGHHVNANVFDQNRIGLLLGYKHNATIRLEAGYINQTLQFGRYINGQPVFQDNNGWIVNCYLNL